MQVSLQPRVTKISAKAMDREMTKPGSIGDAIRFSTDTFPPLERAANFREFVRSRIVKLDHEPRDKINCLNGVAMTLPSLAVVAVNMTPIRCARTREMMNDGNDNVRLVILKRSTSPAPATQLGRDITVEPGSAVVLSNCDLNAITFTVSRSRMLSLNLTRKALRP